MLLKDILNSLSENELIEIIYNGISDGVYMVNELSTSCILCHVVRYMQVSRDKAGIAVANDSKLRDETFQPEASIAFLSVELA